MTRHPLVKRTSPKGQDFLGTCASCGKTNITAEQVSSEECSNPSGYTRERALMEALEPLRRQ
jgi:hypothetical protein